MNLLRFASCRLGLAGLVVLATTAACPAESLLEVTVSAGNHDRANSIVRVPLDVPEALIDRTSLRLTNPQGNQLDGQVTRCGLLRSQGAAPEAARELHFILPALKAGESVTLTAAWAVDASADSAGFQWEDTRGESAQLTYDSRPALRYMYEALDNSSPERRQETFKVYHHLFDPAGQTLLTKGPGGKFPHHRGLFFGFNKVTYGDNISADVWHCTGDAYQSDEGYNAAEAGSVLGRHEVAVDWHGRGGQAFAHERRELAAYNPQQLGGHLIEFSSRVSTAGGPIKLDGDPQHAGFHFRAAQEVAEATAGQTYYLRPDGRGEPGQTRNWPDKKQHVDLPWNAMSFVVGGKRYTAVYLDQPNNPKEARFSERDYGRFGSYFEYTVTEEQPLEISYRLWVQEGELTAEQASALSADFVEPVEVRAEWK